MLRLTGRHSFYSKCYNGKETYSMLSIIARSKHGIIAWKIKKSFLASACKRTLSVIRMYFLSQFSTKLPMWRPWMTAETCITLYLPGNILLSSTSYVRSPFSRGNLQKTYLKRLSIIMTTNYLICFSQKRSITIII